MDKTNLKKTNGYVRPEIGKETHNSIKKLNSLLSGIITDGSITEFEIIELRNWVYHNKKTINCSTFCEYGDVIITAANSGIVDMNFIIEFSKLCKQYIVEKEILDKDESLLELRFFCHGLLADGYISDEEIQGLKTWLRKNSHLDSIYPYDELLRIVRTAVFENSDKEELRLKLTQILFEFCHIQSPRVVNHIQTILTEVKRYNKIA